MTTEDKKSKTAEETTEEEADVETAETETQDEEADVESEEKSEEETKNTDKDIDFDAELEKEQKNKPDLGKAKVAFKERKEKRKEDTDDESEDDEKPLTRKEMQAMLATAEKKTLVTTAFQIAKSFAASDKEAQLIVAKWENRTFPSNVPLSEQIEEMYAVVHRKKIIGERNEAMRGLKGKTASNKDGAEAARESKVVVASKIAPDIMVVIKQSKLVQNPTTKRWERKLPGGKFLIYDQKSKTIVLQEKVS